MGKAFDAQERKVVGGTVILWILAVRCSHKAANRKIEARRAVLALVISVRLKESYAVVRRGLAQHMRDDLVDGRVPSAALLVRHRPRIPEAGEDKTVSNSRRQILVPTEPGQRANGAGYEEKPVAVARRKRADVAREHRRRGYPREIVVGERGM